MARQPAHMQSREQKWSWRCLAVIALVSLALSIGSCVETAECNESVTCPDAEVCYQFDCRPRCESAGDCAGDETCEPCIPPGAVDSSGLCFGEEASACVPQS